LAEVVNRIQGLRTRDSLDWFSILMCAQLRSEGRLPTHLGRLT
jgi:hypothetical protein